MKEHIPVQAGVLELLIDRARMGNLKFSEELALVHIMLDWVQGNQRSRQGYADIWGWSKATVVRRMPLLHDEAEEALKFRIAMYLDEEEAAEQRIMVLTDLFPGMPRTAPKGSASYLPPKAEPDRERVSNQPFFDHDSWQYQYTKAFQKKLQEEGIESQGFKNKPLRSTQMDCYAFDKLHRIDKHSKETIIKVVKYLFTEDDFWIPTRNIQSATKLRRKKNADGMFLFDRLLNDMRTKNNGATRKRSSSSLRDDAAIAFDIIERKKEAAESASGGIHGPANGGGGDRNDNNAPSQSWNKPERGEHSSDW